MRVGIIGMGRMGKLHAQTAREMGHAVYEVDPLHPIEIGTGLIVSSPDNTHAEYVKTMLRLGHPVFCEKPIATNMDDLDEIAEMAKTRPLGCHLPLRQWDVPVAPGEIHLTYHYGRRNKFLLGWRNDPAYDLVLGGGIHMVDWILTKLRPAKAFPVSGTWAQSLSGARTDDFFAGAFIAGNSKVYLTVDFTKEGEHYHEFRSDAGIYKNTEEMDKTTQLKAFLAKPKTDWTAIEANRLCIQFRACPDEHHPSTDMDQQDK